MKIIIIGGGFAGIAAAKKLGGIARGSDVTVELIDKNDYTTMLPSLPDVAGGRIEGRYLIESIRKLIPSSVQFVRDEVREIDFSTRTVHAAGGDRQYDYLVLAAGSATNYYGFSQNLDKIYTLESLPDAERVRREFSHRLSTGVPTHVVISGAGFTGIELACSLFRLAAKLGRTVPITLVEKGARIVPGASDRMVTEIEEESGRLGFEIIKNDFITGFDGKSVTLNQRGTIEDVFFCWCSGVRMPVPLKGTFETLGDNRIKVLPTLQIPAHPEVFVAGDAAAFAEGQGFLRRAVNYAAMGGGAAGSNVAAVIRGGKPAVFKPVDLGWVIPLHITSIGKAFGVEIRGRMGIMMHYVICGVKNYNFRNFRSYVKGAFKFASQQYK